MFTSGLHTISIVFCDFLLAMSWWSIRPKTNPSKPILANWAAISLECPNGSICHATRGRAHSPNVSFKNLQSYVIYNLTDKKTDRIERWGVTGEDAETECRILVSFSLFRNESSKLLLYCVTNISMDAQCSKRFAQSYTRGSRVQPEVRDNSDTRNPDGLSNIHDRRDKNNKIDYCCHTLL